MSRQPPSRERICDALESCRPGSDDLHAPELADVADLVTHDPRWEEINERIQNSDLKIAAAFQDVEIPAGLEQRLVASLRLAQAEHEFSSTLNSAVEGDAETVPPADSLAHLAIAPASKKGRKRSRRWLLASAGLLSAAALLTAIFLGLNNSGGYSKQTVLDDAFQFFDVDTPAAPGKLLTPDSAPAGFRLSKNVRFYHGIRWRTVSGFLGKTGVAFDFPAPAGARATLYAVDRTISDLPVSPADNPSNTGGCYVAAWQEGGLVYVLVVRGSQKNYLQYLPPRGPMA